MNTKLACAGDGKSVEASPQENFQVRQTDEALVSLFANKSCMSKDDVRIITKRSNHERVALPEVKWAKAD